MDYKNDKDSLRKICTHLSNGGDLFTLAELWGTDYADMILWLNQDAQKASFYLALEAQHEWRVSRLLKELNDISFSEVRKLFDDNGCLLNPKDWPKEISGLVSSLSIKELYDSDGEKVGEVKSIKMFDKLKAIELLGKDLGRFINRHEISGKLTLEDLISKSIAGESEDEKKI